MNLFCKRLTVILLGLIVFWKAASVSAAGFEFSPDQVPNQTQIIENTDFTSLDEPPQKFAIKCFDVNTDGLIAIGTENGETNIISVYDPDGFYQYGFTYQSSGTFGVEWEEDTILVYSVRSDLAFRVSPAGEVNEIRQISDTTGNNAYWNNVVFSRQRIVGTDRYYLKNDMGLLNILGFSYAQLVRVHADGTEQILYDVNAEQLTKTVIILLCVLLFAAITFSAIYKQFRKMHKENFSYSG